MSAATANTIADPLAIFGDVVSANNDPQDPSESSQVQVCNANPFDPLGGSQSGKHDEEDAAAPLDLMSQISSWGAQNHHEEKESTAVVSPTPDDKQVAKTNVMSTASNAITLSDDLVAQAHAEFEATEDTLRKFEQEQLGQTAQ